MEQIKSFLETVKLARKQTFQNLTVYPLLKADGVAPDYLTVEQALAAESIRITEVSDQGNVPELKLINFGGVCVLIIEGEELVGAKQNRIVNSTFLIPEKSETVLPVSCVEQGRWRHQSEKFQSGGKIMFSTLRREHQQNVRYSLKQSGQFRSNQGQVWENIAGMSSRMKVSSPTDAMADVFESYENKLNNFTESFQLVELQVGAIFAINGKIHGIECFWYHDTFKRFFEKLLKSYALDAIDNTKEAENKSVEPAKASRFLAAVANSKAEGHKSIGLGTNIRFESRTVTGASLIEGDRVLHLSAFKKESGGNAGPVGYQRSSSRRNRYLY